MSEPVTEEPTDFLAVPSEPVKHQCGAKTRNGGTCKLACIPGRNRCKLHGGATPRGDKLPQFKHGLYSKALPKNLRGEYEKLVNDPALLDARAEIALLKLRLKQLTERIGSNESVKAWEELRDVFAAFRAANSAADAEGMVTCLNRMQQIIDGRIVDDRAWGDLTKAVERVTKVSEKEWRRQAQSAATATADQVRLIVISIAEAVMTHVRNPSERNAIAEHITRLQILDAVPTPAPVEGDDC